MMFYCHYTDLDFCPEWVYCAACHNKSKNNHVKRDCKRLQCMEVEYGECIRCGMSTDDLETLLNLLHNTALGVENTIVKILNNWRHSR